MPKILFFLLSLLLFQAQAVWPQDSGRFDRKELIGGFVGNNAREFFSEEGPKIDFEVDFLDSGDSQTLVTAYDSLLIIETRILGKWRLEGDKLMQRGESLAEVKLSIDEAAKPGKEKRKELTQQMPKLQADLTKKMQEELTSPKESADTILSLEKGILVTKDSQGEVYVFQKK